MGLTTINASFIENIRFQLAIEGALMDKTLFIILFFIYFKGIDNNKILLIIIIKIF